MRVKAIFPRLASCGIFSSRLWHLTGDMENLAICQVSERTHDMAFVVLCPVCERRHIRGTGWGFCRLAKYQQFFAGLRSVQEREEAFWRQETLDIYLDKAKNECPALIAARLVLPCVLARLLDARADPNLGHP